MRTRLQDHYDTVVKPALIKEFGYKNPMQAPKLDKIVINMGVGEGTQDGKKVDAAANDLAIISGQKAVVTHAKKSIATFKLRENLPIGVMVTLRAERMWEFVDRLITFSLPRVRDFKGVSNKGFDGKGNYTMGLREQIIFPEIDYDEVDQTRGLDVTITTNRCTDEESFALLEALGMPFAKSGRPQGLAQS
jgi:large subunit ribosomal protein L5